MILFVSGIVVLCVLPLSTIVYFKNETIVIQKTFEVCQTIAHNIAKIADDELLVGDTFEATTSAIIKLKESNIRGLKDTYVSNLDGHIVARLDNKKKDSEVSLADFNYFTKLTSLQSREKTQANQEMLEFAYPIYIRYEGKNVRIGTAIFEFDSKEIFAPIVDLRNSIFLYSSILLLVGIGIALFLSISLSLPLQVLNDGANEFGAGDFSHRILLKGQDEIGQLATAFNLMGEKIQDFTQNLEQKVKLRTEALNQTLEEVNFLKIAQDGDYYLTSLLLEPLSTNNNSSTNIKTEFVTEQKKKFSFRTWNSQIGGDICITDTVRLGEDDYTVFLNADAMGKSIQGAGGALALGVVFNAGLLRSRSSAESKNFPEFWLKERFLDLQNVFLAFDGTMYISACIGLIENSTGLMYYFNAEHPWTVIYRDGKASFIEEVVDLCKIGTPAQENRFFIKTFQLLDGDTILTGTDGRDDLVIGYDGSNEIINEDGNEFLKRVEEGDGNVTKILTGIKKFGTLYDDISLLSISYQEMAKAESKNTPSFKDLLSLGRRYMESKEWKKAESTFQQCNKLNPGDEEILFQISIAYFELGDLVHAAEFGERLLLRNPLHIPNLIQLSRIFISLGQPLQAKSVLEKANLQDKRDKFIQFELGKAYHVLGDLDRAKSTWEMCLALDPDFKEAKEMLGQQTKQKKRKETLKK